MFRQISWSAFFEVVAIVATVYYVAVFVFYKGQLFKPGLLKFQLVNAVLVIGLQ